MLTKVHVMKYLCLYPWALGVEDSLIRASVMLPVGVDTL